MSLELPKLIDRFSSIIVSSNITQFEMAGSSLRLRARIDFIDESRLFIRETIISGSKRKYAYHWQNKNEKLIMRWDNAPDWDVETFPHHRHMDQQKAVYASYERTLDQVLAFISKNVQPMDS